MCIRDRINCYECCRYYSPNDLQGAELCVSQLKLHGSVWWLNASDHISRTRRSTHTHLLTVLFVFKSCVVIVAQDVSKDKKKNKVTASSFNWRSDFCCDSSAESKYYIHSTLTTADTEMISVEYLHIASGSSRKSGAIGTIVPTDVSRQRKYHFAGASCQHYGIILDANPSGISESPSSMLTACLYQPTAAC